MTCQRPPSGWTCTREGGHDGPCAAVPDAREPVIDPDANLLDYNRTAEQLGLTRLDLAPLVARLKP